MVGRSNPHLRFIYLLLFRVSKLLTFFYCYIFPLHYGIFFGTVKDFCPYSTSIGTGNIFKVILSTCINRLSLRILRLTALPILYFPNSSANSTSLLIAILLIPIMVSHARNPLGSDYFFSLIGFSIQRNNHNS